MSNLNDIREWGRTHGFEIGDGPLPRGLRGAYAKREDHEVITRIVPDEDEGSRVIVEEPVTAVAERAPVVAGPTLVARARKLVGKQPGDAPKVRANKPRRGVDRIIERVWDMVGRVIQPVNLPVARVMAVQAPVAGMLLEDIIKGTVVDSLLQPIIRVEEKAELAFALIGPPLLVGLLTSGRGQQLAPVLVPALKESLRVWLEVAGPKIEAARVREEEFAEKYGAQIDVLIESFFAVPETPNDQTG